MPIVAYGAHVIGPLQEVPGRRRKRYIFGQVIKETTNHKEKKIHTDTVSKCKIKKQEYISEMSLGEISGTLCPATLDFTRIMSCALYNGNDYVSQL